MTATLNQCNNWQGLESCHHSVSLCINFNTVFKLVDVSEIDSVRTFQSIYEEIVLLSRGWYWFTTWFEVKEQWIHTFSEVQDWLSMFLEGRLDLVEDILTAWWKELLLGIVLLLFCWCWWCFLMMRLFQKRQGFPRNFGNYEGLVLIPKFKCSFW